MTIQELAQRASVTPRTVRYYVEQGILPPPERGRPSEYTGEHLRILDLVRRLKEQYLPLEEIRDMMQRLSSEELEDFLSSTHMKARQHEEPQGRPSSSAAEYISQVLNRGAAREQLKHTRQSEPQPVFSVAEPQPRYGAPRPAPAPPTAPLLPAKRQLSTSPQQGEVDTETWQRVRLAPGIELHYTVVEDPGVQEAVTQITEAAKHILGGDMAAHTEENR